MATADQQHQFTGAEFEGSDLSGWCKMAGIATYALLIYSFATMVQMLVFGGQPGTAVEAFGLLQKNRIVGLLRLDLPTVFSLPLYYLLFLGLYAALRRADCANAIFSLALVFVGVTLLLAAPTALSMLPLSEKYAVAETEAARYQILAAGEALMAADIWHGTGAIIGGILLQAGAVLISVVMLQTSVFSRVTAYTGLLTHGFDLAHILVGLFWPAGGFVLMAVAGPLYLVWFPLVGRRLLELAAEERRLRDSAVPGAVKPKFAGSAG